MSSSGWSSPASAACALEHSWSWVDIRRALGNERADVVTKVRAVVSALRFEGLEAVTMLGEGLQHTSSALVRKAILYAIGQMTGVEYGAVVAMQVLNCEAEDLVVRREAAAALSALAVFTPDVWVSLFKHLHHHDAPLRETTELAIIGLQRLQKERQAVGAHTVFGRGGGCRAPAETEAPTDAAAAAAAAASGSSSSRGGFRLPGGSPLRRGSKAPVPSAFMLASKGSATTRTDATPPFGSWDLAESAKEMETVDSIPPLMRCLLDVNSSVWDRHVALNTLRNTATPEAAGALVGALTFEGSALIRAQACTALAKMQVKAVAIIDALLQRLRDPTELPAVRHEAALALGILAPGDVNPTLSRAIHDNLQTFANEKEGHPLITEACSVALWNLQAQNAM